MANSKTIKIFEPKILLANPDTERSCLGCAVYFSCSDPHKSGAWVCNKFDAMEEAHVDDLLGQAQIAIDMNSSMYKKFEDDPEELNEFEVMINRALDDNRLVPLDLSVDESHIPEAKNFYDFCYSGRGVKFRPYARQLWVAAMLFGECCPYCSDPKWYQDIQNVPVDFKGSDMPEHLTFLEYGVCPDCNRGRAKMWRDGDIDIFLELALCIGQRAGKSTLSSVLCVYHLHKVLKTNRPSEFYGIDASTTLTHTYTGLQYKRAFALLWTPIRNTILDAPFFKEYNAFMKSEGERLGEELIVIKDTYINWRRSRLIAAPAAPNVGTLRGDTRIGGAIDELGLFKFGAGAEDYVTISADEIHTSMTNQMATIRNAASDLLNSGVDNVQQAMMFNIGSPISVFDKMMTLVRASVGSRELMGIRLPTWEVNPTFTRQKLQIYWDTDPIKAERDFGANPPLAASPFFEDQEKIATLFVGPKNRVTYEVKQRTNKQGTIERAAAIIRTQEMAKMPPSLMCIDSGVSNNSFSLSISIPVAKGVIKAPPRQGSAGYAVQRKGATPLLEARLRAQEAVQRQLRNRPIDLNSDDSGNNLKCQVQVIIEVIPPKGGRINFNGMFNLCIVPLLKPFNVKVVVTDRWQNILLLDKLRDEHNVDTFQYSLKYKDFEDARSYIEGGRMECPALETRGFENVLTFDQQEYPYCFEGRPIDHLALQFMTVQDNGRTVDKGPNLTDDSFRACALAMHYIRNIDFVQTYLGGAATTSSGAGGGLVAFPGDSSGASQTSHSRTGQASKGVVAMSGGNSGTEVGTTFARTRK